MLQDNCDYHCCTEDAVEFNLEDPKVPSLEPQNIPLDILYEDDDILVINKQAGLTVHAGGGAYDNTLVNALLYHIKDFREFGNTLRPGIVHRLDKEASGVMIIAKNIQNLNILQKQFSSRAVEKEYRAIVLSNISVDEQIINYSIGRNPNDRKKMIINGINTREATTKVVVLERFKEFTYIKAIPKTGRTHQIRVHLSSIKHPILGDKTYGSKTIPYIFTKTVTRFLLHAYKLIIRHPRTGQSMNFTAPIPEDRTNVLKILSTKNNY